MTEVLDDQRPETNPLETNKQQFKFISIGILIGLGVSAISGSLTQGLEALGFKLDLFGLLNRFIIELLTIVIILSLLVLVFKSVRSKLIQQRLSVERLLVYAIAFYLLGLIIQFVTPIIVITEEYYDYYQMNMEQIGQYELYSTIMNLVGYLIIVFGAVIFINRIGRRGLTSG